MSGTTATHKVSDIILNQLFKTTEIQFKMVREVEIVTGRLLKSELFLEE